MNDRLQAATGGRTGPAANGFSRWIGGRANRREYWIWLVPLIVAEVALSGFGYAAMIAIGLVRLLIWIRRLHDLGWTGWIAPAFNFFSSLLTALLASLLGQNGQLASSFILLAAVIALGCIPGEARDNEYGQEPRLKTDLNDTFS